MSVTKRISLAKRAGRSPDPGHGADDWEGPDLGDAFWGGSDDASRDAVFDLVLDEAAFEPRPGETPDAWRGRVEAALRDRAEHRRAGEGADADPPRRP